MAIHKKTGNFYSVIGIANNATNGHESDEMLVVYCRDGKMFVRNVSEFKEKFEKIEILPEKQWPFSSETNELIEKTRKLGEAITKPERW